MGRRRWGLGLLAVAVVALVVVAIIDYRHQQDIRAAQAAARTQCQASKTRQAAQRSLDSTGQPQLVVIGDSYSEGHGLPSVADSWERRLKGYHTIVLAQGGAGYTHEGACGTGIFSSQVGPALAAHPSALVLQGGLNDVVSPPNKVAADAGAVLSRLPAGSVIVGPADAPALPISKEREVDSILRSAASKHGLRYVSLLDLPSDQFGPDRVHPTVQGQQFIAAKVEAVLAR